MYTLKVMHSNKDRIESIYFNLGETFTHFRLSQDLNKEQLEKVSEKIFFEHNVDWDYHYEDDNSGRKHNCIIFTKKDDNEVYWITFNEGYMLGEDGQNIERYF